MILIQPKDNDDNPFIGHSAWPVYKEASDVPPYYKAEKIQNEWRFFVPHSLQNYKWRGSMQTPN